MKKALWLLIVSVMLAGCGKSVGIIGGSDGPTAIFVGESNTEITPVRMIKVEGELFYDSGKFSDLTPRCGTMDGNLAKTAGEFEIPEGDNECNFEGPYGYQNATGMTKELPLEDGWAIFKKIIDEEKDFGQYKYCMKVKGTHPNTVRESEYIVLSKTMDVTFDKLHKHFFSALSTDHMDVYVIPVFPEEEWGVTLFAHDVTKSKMTIVCEQFGGSPTGTLQSGSWYELEYLNDGEWEKVEYLPQDYDVAWTSEAYIIPTNDRVEWMVDWEWLYGKLDEGMYRIGKEITDFRRAGDFDKKIYYAEFYVEE